MHNLASNKFQFLSVYTFIYMVPEQSDLYFIRQGGSWINLVYIFYGKTCSAGRQLNQSSLYIFYGKTCSADGGVVSFPISDTFYL